MRALLTAGLVLLTACGGADPQRRAVTVLAAASLTDALTGIAEQVEAQDPGLDVVLSFGGSTALAQQVLAGAPADVLATASPSTMALVTDEGAAAAEPVVFARNALEIAVPAGNPAGITGLADLADPARTVALCDVQVPCGAAARAAFAAAGLAPAADTLEADVRAVLAKVTLGEVDAGLVYRTDVRSAGDAVEGIALPEPVASDYPVVLLRGTDGARAFVDAVLSEAGQRALADAGFDPA